MSNTIQMLKLIVKDPRGVTAVEYAVIAGVICATLAGGFMTFANKLSTYFGTLHL